MPAIYTELAPGTKLLTCTCPAQERSQATPLWGGTLKNTIKHIRSPSQKRLWKGIVTVLPGLFGVDAWPAIYRRRAWPALTCEAVALFSGRDGVQHRTDVAPAALAELAVVGQVAAGGAGEHDEVAVRPARRAGAGPVVRRAHVVADLVRQRQLGDPRRHARVVVDEGDDAGVERALVGALRAADVVGERFVALADASRRTCRRLDGERTSHCRTTDHAPTIVVVKITVV